MPQPKVHRRTKILAQAKDGLEPKFQPAGVQIKQIVIAYKKLREAASLLEAANERELASKAEALAEQVDRRSVQ